VMDRVNTHAKPIAGGAKAPTASTEEAAAE
jgi:hypothetical protein